MSKSNLTLQSVFVEDATLAKIRDFIKFPNIGEIGGPLVGHITHDNTLIISDLTGPGPKGVSRSYSVTINGAYSQIFCDAAYHNSGGLLDFVGDWHTHPGFSVSPSENDRKAMKLLAGTSNMPTRLVSLIYSSWTHRFAIYQWSEPRQCLVRLKKLPHHPIQTTAIPSTPDNGEKS